MIHLTYLGLIIFSMLGMVMIDKVQRLAIFYDLRRTLITVGTCVAILIVWDIIGIVTGIFFSGDSKYMSGIYLAPEFPIEEIFLLTFISYFTLIIYRLVGRKL